MADGGGITQGKNDRKNMHKKTNHQLPVAQSHNPAMTRNRDVLPVLLSPVISKFLPCTMSTVKSKISAAFSQTFFHMKFIGRIRLKITERRNGKYLGLQCA